MNITPIEHLDAEIIAPPSKAHSLRALFVSALAEGTSVIKNPLLADDQKHAIAALQKMGADISIEENAVVVKGTSGKLHGGSVFIGGSGMTARALASIAALADSDVTIDGIERMRTGRPMQELLDGLKQLGVDTTSNNGCVPVTIQGNSLVGGETSLDGSISSQYFSSILIAAPYAQKQVMIKAKTPISSKPYIDITIQLMKDFGVSVVNKNYSEFLISPQKYIGRDFQIEGDYSSASFFFAAAAITGGKVRVKNLRLDSAQGDREMLTLLEKMGCAVKRTAEYIEVIGKDLVGIVQDMNDYPDIVIPLAVVAAYAKGTTKLTNIGHLRYKESDRLEAPAIELRKMGISVDITDDALYIHGGTPSSAEIETYDDHRMAMSFAMAGLKTPGVVIKNPEVVTKSFPEFWDVFERLYGV